MIQKIKKFVIVGITGLMLSMSGFVPALAGVAFAGDLTGAKGGTAGSNIASGLCTGINESANNTNSNTGCDTGVGSGTASLQKIAAKIINIFSIIVGIVAVLMIIVGGFRYVTSGGSQDKVGGAKNTLIYAIIGLVIVALAQAIVHFVLNQSTSVVSS